MKVVMQILLLLQLLLYFQVQCHEMTLCNNTLLIDCKTYVIAIKNATSVGPYLLEQCNARHECEVPNMDDQCVNVHYWCKINIRNMQTRKSTIMYMKPNQSAVGLMSAGYPKGTYQAAGNINCNITFVEPANQVQKEITFILYDFAAFANSMDFCLSANIDNFKICSGSQNYFSEFGPFKITKSSKISITLARTGQKTTPPMQVRFWLDIHVIGAGVFLDSMECHVEQVKNLPVRDQMATTQFTTLSSFHETRLPDKKSKATNVVTITTSTVLGAILLLITLAFTLVTVLWCRQNKFHCPRKHSNDSGQYDDIADENDYAYIDLDIFDPQEESKSDETAPQVNQEAELISQASIPTWEADLPLMVKFGNDRHGAREKLKYQSDSNLFKAKPTMLGLQALQPSNQTIAVCEMIEEFSGTHGSVFSSSHSEDTCAHKARKSVSSKEPHDYLELIGDPNDTDQLGNVSYIRRANANECTTDCPDYLEPTGDPEDSGLLEEQGDGEENEYDSLLASKEYGNGAKTATEHPYTSLGALKCDSRLTVEESGFLLLGDDTPQEPHDYLELIEDPEDLGLHVGNESGLEKASECDSKEHHDYLELVGEPDDSDPLNVDILLNSENEYASLYTTEALGDGAIEARDHAYTSLSNVQSDPIGTTKGEPTEGCTPQDIQDGP